MTQAVLGLDTSCYTTSCALVDTQGRILANARRMLNVPAGERGLRQSEALFAHVTRLPDLIEQAVAEAGRPQVIAICASDRPADGDDSYMPVFRAGASFARSAAAVAGARCYTTTHQRGHLAAALLDNPGFPAEFLAVHLSGGTTQLLKIAQDRVEALGGTGDISAGQLLDRVGVALGMRFPAGAEMEGLAWDAAPTGRYPSATKGYSLHFSGAEAAAQRDAQAGALPQGQIAAELFDVIARSLAKILARAAEDTGIRDVLLCGGVASSSLLLERMRARADRLHTSLRITRGKPALSSDNAVGVAVIGLRKLMEDGGA
ncbi:MAG TPA: O-sialoglycoprotein endopeptidase [Candidatus Limnocylindria bacterium]|nr:O-sialoglycoprotein endopeptidase [Candidatus Limnocylindria bacterium]